MKTLRTCLLGLAFSFCAYTGNAQVVDYIAIPIDRPSQDSEEPIIYTPRNMVDVAIDSFYSIAPNAMWPLSQLECFKMFASISNQGDETALNTLFQIDVVNTSTNDPAFSDILFEGDLENIPGNLTLSDCFLADQSEVSTYECSYSASTDCNDTDTSNNLRSFEFQTTISTFSKETGTTLIVAPDASNWPDGQPKSWAFGAHYYIVNEVISDNMTATFGIGNADNPNIAGNILSITLYYWTNVNNDNRVDPDERTPVGVAFYSIQGTELPTDEITVPLVQPDFQSTITLESDSDYVLMIEYTSINSSGTTILLAASDEYDYSAQNYISELDGNPRYGQLLGISGDLTSEPYSSIGFSGSIVPVARLDLGESIVSSQNEINHHKPLRLTSFPNPVRNQVFINLPKAMKIQGLNLEIYDNIGQNKTHLTSFQISSNQVDLDVSQLANGVYFVVIQGKETAYTSTFIVQ